MQKKKRIEKWFYFTNQLKILRHKKVLPFKLQITKNRLKHHKFHTMIAMATTAIHHYLANLILAIMSIGVSISSGKASFILSSRYFFSLKSQNTS